ncbi:proteinase inhibitor, propeptide [Artemisia annua]|uniref:Proteinase inhibitor, propeptide n=1 Tax=Artemisia annua TaxID=35608 RepID=A0A2U1P3F5_ARTAN|nr:proteinase inhibitor, propeptide [Artemisia annua]
MSGGITRLKQHLTHTKGDVTGCPKVTTEITKRVLASMQEKDKVTKEKRRNLEILRSSNMIDLSEDKDEDVDDEVHVKRKESKKRKSVGASNVRGPLDSILKSDHEKTNQSILDKNNPIKQKLKMVAWKKFTTWAYAVRLPFNVVRDESFQDMINAIGDYGKCMPTPSHHNLRVTLLKDALEDTKNFVDTEEKPCMGYNYVEMSRAKEQINKNLKVGCFLNPAVFYRENSNLDNNSELKTSLYDAIDKLVPDPEENDTKPLGLLKICCKLSSNMFPIFGHLLCLKETDLTKLERKIMIGFVDLGISANHPSFKNQNAEPYSPLPKYRGKCEVDPATKKVFAMDRLLVLNSLQQLLLLLVKPITLVVLYDSHTAAIAAGNNGIPVQVKGYEFGKASGMAPRASPPATTKTTNLNPFDATLLSAVKAVFVAKGAENEGPMPKTIVSYSLWIASVAAAFDYRRYKNHLTLGNGKMLAGIGSSPSTSPNQKLTLVAANDVLLDSLAPKFSPSNCQAPEVLNGNMVKGNIIFYGYSFNFVSGSACIKKVAQTAKSLGAIGFVLAVENLSPGTKFEPLDVGMPEILITDEKLNGKTRLDVGLIFFGYMTVHLITVFHLSDVKRRQTYKMGYLLLAAMVVKIEQTILNLQALFNEFHYGKLVAEAKFQPSP